MSRTTMLVAGMLFAFGVTHAQTSVGAQSQGGASTQSQSSISTNRQGADAQASGNASASNSADAAAQPSHSSASLADGATMNAELARSLDAARNKPGDRVEARTTQDVKQDGKVIVPKGTMLVGHVTHTEARAKGQSQSTLGVIFDHAQLKNGEQMPMNLGIQALAESQSAAQASATGADDAADFAGAGATSTATSASAGARGSAARAGGLVGGTLNNASTTVGAADSTAGSVAGGAGHAAGAGVGSTVGAASHSAGSVGGLTAAGALTSNSQGVFGLEGMSLDSSASNATQGSMIVSTTKNVHLDNGTQMVLRATGEAH